MNARSHTSQSASSNAIRVPGELRLRGLLSVIVLFLAVDGFAYGVAAKIFRHYQAVTATASDKRLDALGERLDAIERQQRSLGEDLSNAATTAAAALKQSQAAVEGVRQLQQQVRSSRRRTNK
jgi:hypothetical protein